VFDVHPVDIYLGLCQQIFHFVGVFCWYGNKYGVILQVCKLYSQTVPEAIRWTKPEDVRKVEETEQEQNGPRNYHISPQ
jgi:hypothetical protein